VCRCVCRCVQVVGSLCPCVYALSPEAQGCMDDGYALPCAVMHEEEAGVREQMGPAMCSVLVPACRMSAPLSLGPVVPLIAAAV